MSVLLSIGSGAAGCSSEVTTGGSRDGGADAASDGVEPCPALGCAPNCPGGVLKDARGCDTCRCADAGTATCAHDSDCPGGGLCGFLEGTCPGTGQCFPSSGGPRCALPSAIGCGCDGAEVSVDPSCYSGLPDGYQSKPVLHVGPCADGGACVSQRGGPCGGNTSHPCTCAPSLVCTPGEGGAPFGDVGGTCQ